MGEKVVGFVSNALVLSVFPTVRVFKVTDRDDSKFQSVESFSYTHPAIPYSANILYLPDGYEFRTGQRGIRDNRSGFSAGEFGIHRNSYGLARYPDYRDSG